MKRKSNTRPMNPNFSDSKAPETARHVTRECNLIARNLACMGDKPAAAATADHIRRFWAPQLRSTLLEQGGAHPDRFCPIASDAIAVLESETVDRLAFR